MNPQLPVRDRILDSASRLFYAEGIRSISADRIIADAQTTKVTFYRHFRSKDDLVVAYLERQSALMRQHAGELDPDPCTALLQLAGAMGSEACSPGFRGCPFINAAAEYADPAHPARAVVADHRKWLHGLVTDKLTALQVPEPAEVANQLLMLRDGAMVFGYVDDASGVGPALADAGRALVAQRRLR